jgi:hypothetical protein
VVVVVAIYPCLPLIKPTTLLEGSVQAAERVGVDIFDYQGIPTQHDEYLVSDTNPRSASPHVVGMEHPKPKVSLKKALDFVAPYVFGQSSSTFFLKIFRA